MRPRLVLTVRGQGDDGRSYTINAFKERWPSGDGNRVEESVVSTYRTHDGVVVVCDRVEPFEFTIPSTGVRVRDTRTLDEPLANRWAAPPGD